MSERQPPKKRRFWQLRLSTAILSMIFAGIILCPNIVEHGELIPTDRMAGRQAYEDCLVRGWPVPWSIIDAFTQDGHYEHHYEELAIYKLAGCIDAALGIALLFIMGGLCEWLLRRREGRKS